MADLSNLTTRELPPKNHNNPPSELEFLTENLTTRHVSLIRAAESEIEFSANIPPEFTAQNEADFITDYIKKCNELVKDLEKTRKDEKEPFLRQGQAVDSFFNTLKDRLGYVIGTASAPLNAYLRKMAAEEKAIRDKEAEDMRREQEAALKAVQDLAKTAPTQAEVTHAIDHLTTMQTVTAIADKVAAAPIVSMASAGGKYSKAALVKKWVGTIVDKNALDLQELRPYLSEAVLQVALNAYVKNGGRKLEGAKIEETMDAKVK